MYALTSKCNIFSLIDTKNGTGVNKKELKTLVMNVLFSGITFTMILLPIIYRSASMGRHPWFFHQSLKELSTALFQIVVES